MYYMLGEDVVSFFFPGLFNFFSLFLSSSLGLYGRSKFVGNGDPPKKGDIVCSVLDDGLKLFFFALVFHFFAPNDSFVHTLSRSL